MGRVKQQRHMTIQKKSHYKMFKAGKCWLYSEIAMLSVLTGVMVGTESAQASTDGKTDNSAVVITDQNISDNTNSTETLTTATKTNNPSDVPESQQETTDTGQVNVQVSTDQTTIQSGQTAKFNVSVVASGINNDQTKNSHLTVQLR